jgi:hypothetical protein
MPALAWMVPVVWRRQCGCTGQVILALRPAVAISLLIANLVKAWPRSEVKMCGRLGSCSRCRRLRPLASSRFQVVSAVDAALEPADLNGAFASVEIVPSKIDELRDPQAVQERHQGDHVVAVAVAVLLQRSEQSVELVLRKRLALAAVGLSLGPFMFDIPLYSLISRLELMHRHWLSPSLQDSTWHIVV